MAKWKLSRTTQCAKCPWRVSTDPHDIPNGYSVEKHRRLESTIAEPGDVATACRSGIRIMACHEEHESHCLGWLMNQLGPGNNIGLRLHVMNCANMKDVKLIGKQHERFADTLPE